VVGLEYTLNGSKSYGKKKPLDLKCRSCFADKAATEDLADGTA